MKHEWEHTVVDFDTPHRIGSIQNQIVNMTSSDPDHIEGTAAFTFTPGVNGDYSHPQLHYSSVFTSPEAPLDLQDHLVHLAFTDQVVTSGEYKQHP
jgi:hypothetical protein